MSYQSESSKYREIILPYCIGNGLDLGSGGDPIKVDGCISIDLGGDRKADVEGAGINLYWDATQLDQVFSGRCFDYIYSSHLLEDFPLNQWANILLRWSWLIKRGGKMILLLPDRKLYHEHTPVGANQNHKHEPLLGELTPFFKQEFPEWKVMREELLTPYTILCVIEVP